MRAAFTLAAFAGIALAAPHNAWKEEGQDTYVQNVKFVVETVTQTVYVTDGGATPAPTPVAQQVNQPVAIVAPTPTPQQAAQPKQQTPTTGTGYMAVVNTWRQKLGLKALQQTSALEANANKCVSDSRGQMVHELNPGTFAQVLAPGSESDFEHVFVGGWLCEIPNLPGLDGVCAQQSTGWSYNGNGHAKILTDPSYSKIGCALGTGIWACDLA